MKAWIVLGASLMLVLVSGASVCALEKSGSVDVKSLRMERVELNLRALVGDLGEEAAKKLFEKARKEGISKSMAYWPEESGNAVYIWCFSDKADDAAELLEEAATEPREKWRIKLQVHGRIPWDIDPAIRARERAKIRHRDRKEVLGQRLEWRDKTTVGDALQTLADEFAVAVVLRPGILGKSKNDWRALLKEQLSLGDNRREGSLVLGDLLEILEEKFETEAQIGEFFVFETKDEIAERERFRGSMGK